MSNQPIYQEKLTSNRTEALFIGLTLIFLGLFIWRVSVTGWYALTWTFLIFAALFLFYCINYRTLIITITHKELSLNFGIFTWHINLDNIEEIYPDNVTLLRMGGAGIHFTSIGKRYRAMFNFLEYPRLVVKLKRQHGPVKDVIFSTKKPEEVKQLLYQKLQ